jgi:hypothetical protein
MRRSTTTTESRRMSPTEARAAFEQLRADIAEDLKDLSPEEQEALFDRWIEDVNDGLRQRVLRQRVENGVANS